MGLLSLLQRTHKLSNKGPNKGINYILSNSLLKRVNPYVFLPASYDFRVLMRLLRFLLSMIPQHRPEAA